MNRGGGACMSDLGSRVAGKFPEHHALTCMTPKNAKRVTSTQHMHQGPHNTCMQLNQTQTRPNRITKLTQLSKFDNCNFSQKHSDNTFDVVI